MENNIQELITNHVIKLYSNEFEEKLQDVKDNSEVEKDISALPFIVQVDPLRSCVFLYPIGTFKKEIIQKITNVNDKLTSENLKINSDIKLSVPFVYTLEQFPWWKKIEKVCRLKTDIKWTEFNHNGPYFDWIENPYIPMKATISYNNSDDVKIFKLTPLEEEVLLLYAQKIISESNECNTSTDTKDTNYQNNFWNDFISKYASDDTKKYFKGIKKFKFDKLDWNNLILLKKTRIDQLKNTKKHNLTWKRSDIVKKQALKNKYGFVQINGTFEPIMGGGRIMGLRIYNSKKPAINGKIAPHIKPEQVILNLSKNAPIPLLKKHKWNKIINEQSSEYCWVIPANPTIGIFKPIHGYPLGQFKNINDLCKYEKARKLNKNIKYVVDTYRQFLNSKNIIDKQCATVVYLLETLGIRPGGELSKQETGTYGATTLLVKHITFGSDNKITLNFPGKKKVIYNNTITVDTPYIYDNLKQFLVDKTNEKPIFDKIDDTILNIFLKKIDKDLTSKVFRTRLGSSLVNNELKLIKLKSTSSDQEKIMIWMKVNEKIATALNHQRSKAVDNTKVKKIKDEIKQLKVKLEKYKEDKKTTCVTNTKKTIQNKKIQLSKSTSKGASSTSLASYIDPRLVVNWTDKVNLDIGKIYSVANQTKFLWAIDMIDKDWDYDNTKLYDDINNINGYNKNTETKIQSLSNIQIVENITTLVSCTIITTENIEQGHKLYLTLPENIQKIFVLLALYVIKKNIGNVHNALNIIIISKTTSN